MNLKDFINKEYIDKISEVISEFVENFDKIHFKNLIFDKQWENRELKQRTHHIAYVLSGFLDPDYRKSSKQIIQIAQKLDGFFEKGKALGNLFLPDFIEDFGTNDFENSIIAIEEVTKLMSCEFAVRPFYRNFPEKMMKQTLKWAKNDDFRVRRLASEGCRSKLPWAMSVPYLSDNPEKIMKILEVLFNDQHEWVRLSVSNNLNDISKDYPEIVLDFAEKNLGKSSQTDKLLKHSLRTLLKKGNERALKLFGYEFSNNVILTDFKIKNDRIKIGDNLKFELSVKNIGKHNENVRLEYVIYFAKFDGNFGKKVFKISEIILNPDEVKKIIRKRSFQPMTTRKLYPGLHKIEIVINGKTQKILNFQLLK